MKIIVGNRPTNRYSRERTSTRDSPQAVHEGARVRRNCCVAPGEAMGELESLRLRGCPRAVFCCVVFSFGPCHTPAPDRADAAGSHLLLRQPPSAPPLPPARSGGRCSIPPELLCLRLRSLCLRRMAAFWSPPAADRRGMYIFPKVRTDSYQTTYRITATAPGFGVTTPASRSGYVPVSPTPRASD